MKKLKSKRVLILGIGNILQKDDGVGVYVVNEIIDRISDLPGDAVRKAGGWEHSIRTGRNHEERTVCGRLQQIGYKTGIATRIRAYHPFGKETGGNWGYDKSFTPEMQKHNPDLEQYVLQFDNPDAYNNKTWLPK